MVKMITRLPEYLITPIISSIAIVIGAVIGGLFSWIITKKSTDRTIEVENRIVEDNRKYDENIRVKKSREYANIIRLDICTALFNSIRILKAFEFNEEVEIYPIPMNRNYSRGISYLKSDFQLKELSYIYQIYGIIEKLNNVTNNINYNQKDSISELKKDFQMFLRKLYGNKQQEILKIDIDKVSYNKLYDNSLMKEGYKEVLKKLDNICDK